MQQIEGGVFIVRATSMGCVLYVPSTCPPRLISYQPLFGFDAAGHVGKDDEERAARRRARRAVQPSHR